MYGLVVGHEVSQVVQVQFYANSTILNVISLVLLYQQEQLSFTTVRRLFYPQELLFTYDKSISFSLEVTMINEKNEEAQFSTYLHSTFIYSKVY